MKKIYSLISAAIVAASVANAANPEYTTPGDKKVYNFEILSGIESSGVEKVETGVYKVTGDVTIAATDTFRLDNKATVKLGDKVVINIAGYGDLCVADTAVITRIDDTVKPKGVYFNKQETSNGRVKNVTFEYSSLRYIGCAPLYAENCTWYKSTGTLGSSSNGGAVSFATTTGLNVVKNCYFISNQGPAVAGGANILTGLRFEGNYLYDNNTDNRNKPQINLNQPGEEPLEIINNTIVGTRRNMVGGISVSNMFNTNGTHKVLIEGNKVSDCRYGITVLGLLDVVIKNNVLMNNNAETNPMNGGSGINITDPNYKQTCVVTGNHIEGHLWGVTIIGGKSVNVGKVGDVNAADYNPGLNVFKNNGNNDKLYDLYNNGTNTVYAQGNTWNVAQQTAELIATVIFDKSDDENLGEVIYMPAGSSNVTGLLEKADKVVYNKVLAEIQLPAAGDVQVYSISGVCVAQATGVEVLSLRSLSRGVYVARTSFGTIRFVK